MDDLRLSYFDNLIDTDSELLNYKISIFVSLTYLLLSLMRPSSLLTVFFWQKHSCFRADEEFEEDMKGLGKSREEENDRKLE